MERHVQRSSSGALIAVARHLKDVELRSGEDRNPQGRKYKQYSSFQNDLKEHRLLLALGII